jgi:glycerol-3-phosphate dehydrogenase
MHSSHFLLLPGEPLPGDCLQADYDLIVVGGGIYGAWTALVAGLRGLRVALLERREWASGTSCASSKLIHGGLRYLEHGDLGLVRKALRERSRLLRHAPHRVRPLRFVVPVTRTSRMGSLQLTLGLALYDALAGDLAGVEPARRWERSELLSAAPFLAANELTGGFTYGDAGTDDAALVRDVVAAAQGVGVTCCAHTPVAALMRAGGRVHGVELADGRRLQARSTVLCAGPWAFRLAGLDPLAHARFTKGVHLELPPLPLAAPFSAPDTAFLLTAPQDGRVFFLIPWRGGTMVGTTDTDHAPDADALRVESADVAYLLAAVAANCPGLGWGAGDVRRSWAGLRTLQRSGGGASTVSREWALLVPEPGLLLPVGGKLTSARVEAERIVAQVLGEVTASNAGDATS